MPGLQLQPRRPLPHPARHRARHALGPLVGGRPVRRRRLGLDGGGAGEARRQLLELHRQPRPDQRGARDGGLAPIDFHIAVTTTSVFWNPEFASSFCRSDCAGAGVSAANVPRARRCAAGTTAAARSRCSREGERPRAIGATPRAALAGCGAHRAHLRLLVLHELSGEPDGTSPWTAIPTRRATSCPRAANPRVLHFDKELYDPRSKNRQGFDAPAAHRCSSAARRSAGTSSSAPAAPGRSRRSRPRGSPSRRRSRDSRRTRSTSPAGRVGPDDRTASAAADWPRENSKLVLVFVGDEDDCSSPDDASGGIVMRAEPTGADACVRDASRRTGRAEAVPGGRVRGLLHGPRPPARRRVHLLGGPDAPAPGTHRARPACCCQANCPDRATSAPRLGPTLRRAGAGAPALRRGRPAPRQGRRRHHRAPICDSQLRLAARRDRRDREAARRACSSRPSPPRARSTLLRIADTNGQTRKTCNGPAPAGTSVERERGRAGTGGSRRRTTRATRSTVSQFVYINHATGNCEANPGETYSADYIALTRRAAARRGTDCQRALGGRVEDWGCYTPPGTTRGTCVCCAPGSTQPECQTP